MCERVELPGGGFAIICGGRHRRPSTCIHCPRPSEVLCDHRNGDGQTCDAPLCRTCALHVGKHRDYCKHHAKVHAPAPALPFEPEAV